MRTGFPRFIALIAALIAVVAFFLPYISATEELVASMDKHDELILSETMSLTLADLMDMSLFTYARTYILGGEALYQSSTVGYVQGGIFFAVGITAALSALWVIAKKPVLLFLNNALTAGLFYLVESFMTWSGIMPNPVRMWGIAHELYYPLTAVIAVCAVWIFIGKKLENRRIDYRYM